MTRGLQKLAIIIEWAVAKSHNGTPSGRPLRSPNRGIFLRAESYSKQCCQFEFIAAQRRIRRGRPVKASRYALRVSRSVVVSLSLLRRSRICIQENAGRRSQFAKPCLIDQLHILADCSRRDALWANVSKFRKTNKRPSRICGGLFVYDLSGGLHSSRT